MEDIPEWAYDRAYEFTATGEKYFVAFARYISEHETPPVDLLMIEAQNIAADTCKASGADGDYVHHMRQGAYNNVDIVQAAYAALKSRENKS